MHKGHVDSRRKGWLIHFRPRVSAESLHPGRKSHKKHQSCTFGTFKTGRSRRFIRCSRELLCSIFISDNYPMT